MSDHVKEELQNIMARLGALIVERENDPKFVREQELAEQRRVASAVASELTRLGVPRKIRDELRRGKVRETEPIAAVRQAMADNPWVLVLSGPGGIGKDFAIAELLRQEAVERAKGTKDPFWAIAECWLSIPVLLPEAINRFGTFDPVILRNVSRMSTLVLEDLGTEPVVKNNDKVLSWLFAVFNERHKHSRRTFVTTNLDKKACKERYGKRIFDRLKSNGAFWHVNGPDLRCRGVAEKLPLAGGKAPEQLHLAGKRTVRPAQYRVRYRPLSPRAQARRRQLELRFA